MFKEHFLPSLIPNEYDLIIKTCPQFSKTGCFGSPGFAKTVKLKLEIFLQTIETIKDPYFMFTDADVQFFGPTKSILEEAIQDYDFVSQGSRGAVRVCTGFFVCKTNDTMFDVFKKAKEKISKNFHDEDAVNLYRANFYWDHLDSEQFWASRRRWVPGKPLNAPWDKILMHHACYAVGVENKKKMLRDVRDMFLLHNK
jgi:hypothetical protein